jgi:hypothetical protein
MSILNITSLTSSDDQEIISLLTGKEVSPIETRGTFNRQIGSRGYYDKNRPTVYVGLIFKTPTGRDSKLYDYAILNIEEEVINGESNFFATKEGFFKLKKEVECFTSSERIREWINMFPKLKHKPKQEHVKIVLSLRYGNAQKYLLKAITI